MDARERGGPGAGGESESERPAWRRSGGGRTHCGRDGGGDRRRDTCGSGGHAAWSSGEGGGGGGGGTTGARETSVYDRLLAESRRPARTGVTDRRTEAMASSSTFAFWSKTTHAPHSRQSTAHSGDTWDHTTTTEDEGREYWANAEPDEGTTADAAGHRDEVMPVHLPSRPRRTTGRHEGQCTRGARGCVGRGSKVEREKGSGALVGAMGDGPQIEECAEEGACTRGRAGSPGAGTHRTGARSDYTENFSEDDNSGTGERITSDSESTERTGSASPGAVSESGSSGEDGDAEGMPTMDTDVLAALRRQNNELRERLRQATDVLSKVAAERAVVASRASGAVDRHSQADETVDTSRELCAVREERDRLRLEVSAQASAAVTASTEADKIRARLREEATEAQVRAEEAEKREARAEATAASAKERAAAAEARSSALELQLSAAQRALAEMKEAAEEARAVAMWRAEDEHERRHADEHPHAHAPSNDTVAATLAAAAEAEALLRSLPSVTASTPPALVDLAAAECTDPVKTKPPPHPLVLAAHLALASAAASAEETTALRAALTGQRRLRESEAAVVALEAQLERERRLRADLQLAADADEVCREHSRALERRCAGLEADVENLDRVIAHLHRNLRRRCAEEKRGKREPLEGAAEEGVRQLSVHGTGRAAAFGLDTSDSGTVLFFCFKFWQQLSRMPLDVDAPLTPPTPNPLLIRRGAGEHQTGSGGDAFAFFHSGDRQTTTAACVVPSSRDCRPRAKFAAPPPLPVRAIGPIATVTPPRVDTAAVSSAAAYYRQRLSGAASEAAPDGGNTARSGGGHAALVSGAGAGV